MRTRSDVGTRADFYVGRGLDAQWIGSGSHDGYPCHPGIPLAVRAASSAAAFRAAVARLLDRTEARGTAMRPERGWPWPWADSRASDYGYFYERGAVWVCAHGCGWLRATPWRRGERSPKLMSWDVPHMSKGPQHPDKLSVSGLIGLRPYTILEDEMIEIDGRLVRRL